MLSAVLLATAISSCVVFAAQTPPPTVTPAQTISAEEVLPQDPSERQARLVKNRYFNGGHYDLTRDEDRFIEHYAPARLPVIPLKESGIVFVGSLLKIQPYLSEDRTHVYTEMTFGVEDDLFKSPSTITRPADGTLIIDRIGGTMRLRSGQVVRDYTDLGIGGNPYIGGRYVVFAKEQPNHGPLDIVRAYELRDGRVFRLAEDGKPGEVLLTTKANQIDDPLSNEQTFLQAVRAGSK